MSAFSDPQMARRANGRPWPVVRRQRRLQDAHRAAQSLRSEVLFLAIRPNSAPDFNPYRQTFDAAGLIVDREVSHDPHP